MVFVRYAKNALSFAGFPMPPCTDGIADAIDDTMDTGLLMCWGAIADA